MTGFARRVLILVYTIRQPATSSTLIANDISFNLMKQTYVLCDIYDTNNPSLGSGVKLLETVRKNTKMMMYTGELITVAEMERRKRKMKLSDMNFVLLKHGMVIDGSSPHGNISSIINHSCRSNCRLECLVQQCPFSTAMRFSVGSSALNHANVTTALQLVLFQR